MDIEVKNRKKQKIIRDWVRKNNIQGELTLIPKYIFDKNYIKTGILKVDHKNVKKKTINFI